MADNKEGTTTVEPTAPKNEQVSKQDRLAAIRKEAQALRAQTQLTSRMSKGCFVLDVTEVRPAKDGRPFFGVRLRGFMLKAAYRNVWGTKDKDGNIQWDLHNGPEQFQQYQRLFELAQEAPEFIDDADIAHQGVAEVRLLDIEPETVMIDGFERTITKPRVIAFAGEDNETVAKAYNYTLRAANSQQQNGGAEVEEESDAIAQMNLN